MIVEYDMTTGQVVRSGGSAGDSRQAAGTLQPTLALQSADASTPSAGTTPARLPPDLLNVPAAAFVARQARER